MIPHSPREPLPKRIDKGFSTSQKWGKDSTHWVPWGGLQERLNGFRDKVMTLLTGSLLEGDDSVQQWLGCMTKVF